MNVSYGTVAGNITHLNVAYNRFTRYLQRLQTFLNTRVGFNGLLAGVDELQWSLVTQFVSGQVQRQSYSDGIDEVV